jgi:hypothetical protein
MARIGSFFNLDWRTVKPYLGVRLLIIELGVFIWIGVMTKSATNILGAGCMLPYLIGSYPFAIGEASNLDALYATLGLKRRDVVTGRYAFVMCLDLLGMIIAFMISYLVAMVLGWDINLMDMLIVTGIMFAGIVLIQALQMPLYFKVGYRKASIMAYLPLFIVIGSVVALASFMPDFFTQAMLEVVAHKGIAAFVGVAAFLIIVLVSYRVALMFYSKREF